MSEFPERNRKPGPPEPTLVRKEQERAVLRLMSAVSPGTVEDAYCRGLTNCHYYFGGFLMIILVIV